MIRYLTHEQIDKEAWDRTVSQAFNRKVYAFSWYLDIVSPGWEALADDSYHQIFPLTCNRKWGVRYLFQPYFTQQLGLFANREITGEMIDRFIHAIPGHFRLVDIHLNEGIPRQAASGNTGRRINHVLNMLPEYNAIKSGYAQNTKRNLKKAGTMDLTVHPVTNATLLVHLFRDNYGLREGKLKAEHYQTMQALIERGISMGKGSILGVSGPDGVLQAAAFLLNDHHTFYFLFAASSHQGRETGAMTLLIDRFIRENAHSDLLLDFEGGNDPQLGRFYKGFGANEVFYPVLKSNRLPWHIRLGYVLLRNRP
jgi:hypothetical protein